MGRGAWGCSLRDVSLPEASPPLRDQWWHVFTLKLDFHLLANNIWKPHVKLDCYLNIMHKSSGELVSSSRWLCWRELTPQVQQRRLFTFFGGGEGQIWENSMKTEVIMSVKLWNIQSVWKISLYIVCTMFVLLKSKGCFQHSGVMWCLKRKLLVVMFWTQKRKYHIKQLQIHSNK